MSRPIEAELPPSKKIRSTVSDSGEDEKSDVPLPQITQFQPPTAQSVAMNCAMMNAAGLSSSAPQVDPIPVSWGHPDPMVRGPIVATIRHANQRNAIGAHQGSYCVYTGLAVAANKLNPNFVPNLKLTSPVFNIGPHKSWSDPKKIASLDPFGHMVTKAYSDYLDRGWDIRPTIAITKAHIDLPECREAVKAGRLVPDGKILLPCGKSMVSKAACDSVWYLPEIARRFGTTEMTLRQSIYQMTNGMYPELITRPDIKVFLPPIGGLTIYIWGDPDTIPDEDVELTCRVHDECNGSDVFGSDICTCRPYLSHAVEECIKTAQRGGCGIVIYYRKEGRSLGEVTKYLVYNTRKRQEGGDSAANYFSCTEQVAGVQDTRFQALMPDPLHFLGVTKIHNFISMSDMKYNAIVSTGIKIVNRVEIPAELVPADAQVEITAKVFHGYNGGKAYTDIDEETMLKTKGREYGYAPVDETIVAKPAVVIKE